jgi:cell division protein FtsB
MERVKANWLAILQALLSIVMIVFLAGAWKGQLDSRTGATVEQVQALSEQIVELKKEVQSYADENRNLHAQLAEQFVTRREWLMLLDHTGKLAVK